MPWTDRQTDRQQHGRASEARSGHEAGRVPSSRSQEEVSWTQSRPQALGSRGKGEGLEVAMCDSTDVWNRGEACLIVMSLSYCGGHVTLWSLTDRSLQLPWGSENGTCHFPVTLLGSRRLLGARSITAPGCLTLFLQRCSCSWIWAEQQHGLDSNRQL